jgi:taurine dioxygenase
MTYETISVAPIAGALGAEVSGADLAQELPDATIAEIRRALLDHLVIFFRDQDLTPEQHLALGRRFGPLQVHDFVEAMPEHPEILVVRKEPEETRNFGGGWHTDVSYLERPSLGSLLYALKVPEFGGDTLFANQYLAYETLSDGMKRMLDGLIAIHSARRPYGVNAARAQEYGPPRCALTSARKRTRRSRNRWFAPMAKPAARRSTSTAPSRCASGT